MLLKSRLCYIIPQRNFKNFGHKRQKIPLITTLWTGFLTCTLVGLVLDWNKFGQWMFGDENRQEVEHIEIMDKK